jgi:hypothetical protein
MTSVILNRRARARIGSVTLRESSFAAIIAVTARILAGACRDSGDLVHAA